MSSNTPIQQKMKKLKSKAKEKASNANRKRRINSEKHIEERDEELPWPPPTESAIAIYNQLIASNFKLKNLDHTNFLSSSEKSPKLNSIKDKDSLTLNSVHKKLDQLLERDSQSQMQQSFDIQNASACCSTSASASAALSGFSTSAHVHGTGTHHHFSRGRNRSRMDQYQHQINQMQHQIPSGVGIGQLPMQIPSNFLRMPHSHGHMNALPMQMPVPIIPVAPASSEEIHTIYNNPCHIRSGPFGGPLPPIGVFWDIENCSVPKGRSALSAVQRIRDRFFPGHYEAEFICVCDIRKEPPSVIQELNDAQVSVVHVSGNSKNAADDKLRQSMRRFADIYSSHGCSSSPFPATIVLISGDINFSSDLSDLRHRKRLYVILLHNKHAPEALLLCAHEQYEFHSLLANLPARPFYRDREYDQNNQKIPLKGGLHEMDVLVCDLPYSNSKTQMVIKNRLRKLSENCGGKVITVQGQFALVRFPNKEAALRATKRMNGEDVLGSKIRVIYSSQMEFQNSNFPVYESASATSNSAVPVSASGSTAGVPLALPLPPRVRELSLGPAWKPTWKGRTASDTLLSKSKPITPRNAASFNQTPTSTSQKFKNQSFHQSSNSNSSSPFDSSRDSREGSPCVNRKQYIPVHTSTPLNNSVHFGQNNVVKQPEDSHLLQQKENNELATGKGASSAAAPRLYSTPFAPRDRDVENQNRDRIGTSGAGGSIPNIHLNLNNAKANSISDSVGANAATGAGAGSVSLSNFTSSGNTIIRTTSSSPEPSQLANSTFGTTTPIQMAPFKGMGVQLRYEGTEKDKDHFDLHVTNLDPALGDWKVIRQALITSFGEHVGVKGVWVYMSQDGSVSAVVRVSNKEEAHYAVAQLHRKKFGNKRIFISFDQGGNVDQETLKKEVASLLQDVPGTSLPLFKFREMFEKRYRRSVSSSDLYRLRDVVMISENGAGVGGSGCTLSGNIGRTISLSREWKNKCDKNVSLYCSIHPPKKPKTDKLRTGWAEKEAEILLPNVVIELKTLATHVHSLLNSHEGTLYLISFLDCYEAEFGKMETSEAGAGVPLEHLLACVQGVDISYAENGMKRIKWNEKKDLDAGFITQPLATQLAQFGREMIDLLKTFPRCSLAFSKLIPAYHHHFGRQCRVADYGHFNLQSLLQTLPHVIQIMGTAQNRVLTLSHRAQMKRFATDLLRVLKAHGGSKKQIKMSEFPTAFSQVFLNKQFSPEDYGLCCFSDLVSELVETSALVALVKDEDGSQMLAVPKREQTPQEIHRTRIFATEVIELFRHSIRYEMPFSKFIPAYHHHFGRQCRVSDYGFSKLAELFEAIVDTVDCVMPHAAALDCNNEDRLIRLVPREQVKVVGEQLSKLITKQKEMGNNVRLSQVDELFLEEHGFQLRPEMCDAEDIEELVTTKLSSYIKVEDGFLSAVDQNEIKSLIKDIISILEDNPDYEMELEDFLSRFRHAFDTELNLAYIEGPLSQVLLLSTQEENGKDKQIVSLAPLRIFAKKVTKLLEDVGGSLMISNLESVYLQKFGQPLRPAQMGYPSLLALVQAIPDVLHVRGKHRARQVCLVGSSADFSTSDTSSHEDSFRSQNHSHSYSFKRHSGGGGGGGGDFFRDRNNSRSRSAYSNAYAYGNGNANASMNYGHSQLKVDTGTRCWSDPPKPLHQYQNRRAPPPPPLFTPTMSMSMPMPMGSPAVGGAAGFPQGGDENQSQPSVFTFDPSHAAPISPPMYDLWMRESMSPSSPPISPPVVWTYHPIVYPPNTPPANTNNIMVPHFSYTGPWSPPMTFACFDRIPQPQQAQGNTSINNDFGFDQQSRLSQGIERLVLGQEGRNEA